MSERSERTISTGSERSERTISTGSERSERTISTGSERSERTISTGSERLLETRGLTVTFGGVRALDGIDLAVDDGQIVGLIGPNGAGKTTFIDALTGFVPASGRITFAGDELAGVPAHKRGRRGLARTWQSLELFDDLSVVDNLAVAAQRQSAGRFLADLVRPGRRRDRAGIELALDVLGLADLRDATPGAISQGQRKLVGVAARSPPGRGWCAWTNQRPGSTPPRAARSRAACAGCATPASRCCSSITT